MTLTQLEAIIKDVDAQQLAAFLQRGQLLTQRDGIDSAIRNAEKARDAAYNTANAEIEILQTQRATVQAQIDAL